jgi:hypothetical protein
MLALIKLVIIVLMLAALWKVFLKAGQPGWAAIIPFYNFYILLMVAAKPGWWLILMFIPLVNLVIAFLTCLGVAEKFGKGAGFAVGMFFLPFIFYPILAFSDAQYSG